MCLNVPVELSHQKCTVISFTRLESARSKTSNGSLLGLTNRRLLRHAHNSCMILYVADQDIPSQLTRPELPTLRHGTVRILETWARHIINHAASTNKHTDTRGNYRINQYRTYPLCLPLPLLYSPFTLPPQNNQQRDLS